MAGKMLNFDDERSKLFFTFADIIDHYKTLNPNLIFVLENVSMESWCEEVISERLGVDPVKFNGALVSAQNRVRLWWTNLPVEGKPKDKGIFLKDILEPEVDAKYYVSDKLLARLQNSTDIPKGFSRIDPAKAATATARQYANYKGTFIKTNVSGQPKAEQNKASCFTAGAHSGGNHSDMDLIRVTKDGFHQYRNDEKKSSIQGSHVTFEEGRVHCVTSAHKPQVLLGKGGNNVPYVNNIRRLNEVEVERLFTLPDNFTEGISSTQRYRCLGNGWIVDAAAFIFSFIGKPLRNHRSQARLF